MWHILPDCVEKNGALTLNSFQLPSNLPIANQKRIAVRVLVSAEKHLRKGHPWIFDRSIESISHTGEAGDLAVIFDRYRRFMAIGLYDPESPIRIKILHTGKPVQINTAWFNATINTAVEKRSSLAASDTNGYRLINGENDHLPGLIADRYADTIVLKVYSTAWLPHLRTVLDALVAIGQPTSIVLRLSRHCQNLLAGILHDGDVIYGDMESDTVSFRENGLAFEADLITGQKTGFFLDQRNNRSLVKQYSGGKSVLDLFASTGGFSVYAAAGGAQTVTSVDSSAPTLAAAKRNMQLNRDLVAVANCQHHLIVGDAFATLERMGQQGRKFDMVIIDPPSFAHKQTDIDHAIHAYMRLTMLGLAVVKPKGILVQASCSSRVSAEQFFATIQKTARKHKYTIKSMHQTAHALDHPISFAEGAYLKCEFIRVMS